MKNKSLVVQIWLVCAAITVGVSISLMIFIPTILSDFFTKEIYNTIEHAQQSFPPFKAREPLLDEFPSIENDQELQNVRTVQHMIMLDNGKKTRPIGVSALFLEETKRQIAVQNVPSQRYSKTIGEHKVFYVIRKERIHDQSVFLVSFMWDTYYNGLVKTLYQRLAIIMAIITLLSWLPSLWLAKYLSRPLVQLEEHVKRMANRDWRTSLIVDRQDEIGKLAHSIERMREQLQRQDETQQSLLQHISHELKTPVMVIRSYAGSIQDGVFPKGDLSSSVEVIEKESERLEKRIRDLLYLTKLDYLSTHTPKHEAVKIDTIIEQVVDRLKWHKPDLNWQIDVEPISFSGDREQWTVAFENILDNQIRYAETAIHIQLKVKQETNREVAIIRIWNDGPEIKAEQMSKLFHQFQKGYKGEFGLGLAIVQRIATLHQAEVWANNEHSGVAFYIAIPLINNETKGLIP